MSALLILFMNLRNLTSAIIVLKKLKLFFHALKTYVRFPMIKNNVAK